MKYLLLVSILTISFNISANTNGNGDWEFVSLNCSGSCSTGTGVLYNKKTGEAYSLFPQKSEIGLPQTAFLKINFYVPPKEKK